MNTITKLPEEKLKDLERKLADILFNYSLGREYRVVNDYRSEDCFTYVIKEQIECINYYLRENLSEEELEKFIVPLEEYDICQFNKLLEIQELYEQLQKTDLYKQIKECDEQLLWEMNRFKDEIIGSLEK